MSETRQDPDFIMNPGEKTTMLFMQMVLQQSGLATMLLGKAPHPETGEIQRDLPAAQVMIDQLEMLETKTKGNLNREEEQFLKQTLMSLRMAYVEAVNQPETKAGDKQAQKESASPGPDTSTSAESPEATPTQDEESKKRFTKKY